MYILSWLLFVIIVIIHWLLLFAFFICMLSFLPLSSFLPLLCYCTIKLPFANPTKYYSVKHPKVKWHLQKSHLVFHPTFWIQQDIFKCLCYFMCLCYFKCICLFKNIFKSSLNKRYESFQSKTCVYCLFVKCQYHGMIFPNLFIIFFVIIMKVSWCIFCDLAINDR